MQQLLEKKILVVFFVTYIYDINFVKSTTTPKSLYLWSWECLHQKCTPVKKLQIDGNVQSLETCNMLCSPHTHIWPLPTGKITKGRTAVAVHPQSFNMDIVTVPSVSVRLHLLEAFDMFKQDLRSNIIKSFSGLGGECSVTVKMTVHKDEDPRLRLDTEEGYRLKIEPEIGPVSNVLITIIAPSFCGARHALETLLQLIWLDPYADSLFIIQEATIVDEPRFPYRGLMIDTARHYIPLHELMRTVDAMAASKLNTLHWHATDSQAFSLQLASAPHLAQHTAYDVYTVKEIKALVRRARLRGIRVLIEIDTPAHVNSAWSKSEHENFVLTECNPLDSWNIYCEDPPCGQLNPTTSAILGVLQNIYSEIVKLTEVDDIFHLGGDDVSEACWRKVFNDTEPLSLWLEYTRQIIHRIQFILGKMPTAVILWSSPLCQYIKTDLKDFNNLIAFQVRNKTFSENLNNINTIISHEQAWDLNSGYGSWYDGKSKKLYNSWQRFYDYQPWKDSGQEIGGGEATLWSWDVDEGGIHERIWPRAAAMAERLWSDQSEGITEQVQTRLDVHLARMAARGIHSVPIWSHWCTQHPYTCS